VFGPKPIFRKFASVEQELQSIAIHLKHLITKEGVSPEDICLIYNGRKAVEPLESRLGPAMADIDVEISVQTSRSFQRRKNTLLVTTSHSFKGYESEVVLIPCADQYVTSDNQILANNLYVAMTRARSLLAVYSLDDSNSAIRQLNDAFEFCAAALDATPSIVSDSDTHDDLNEILDRIGPSHRKWLETLWEQQDIQQEPIVAEDGSVVAEPLFWFEKDGKRYACFDPDGSSGHTSDFCSQGGIFGIRPGDAWKD
jgi:hypothetical protein